jgi:hypothetical protein
MAGLGEPLLIHMDSDDRAMPPARARKLFERAGLPVPLKRLQVLQGASHNDVPAHPGFLPAYRDLLRLVTDPVTRG